MSGNHFSGLSAIVWPKPINSEEAEKLDQIRAQLHQNSSLEFRPPWENERGEQLWSDARVCLGRMVLTTKFEAIMGVIIAFNFFIIIYETDQDGTCYPKYYNNFQNCPTSASKLDWLWGLNLGFLIIYTIEGALRISVFCRLYWFDKWNYLDLFIILSGWLQEIMGGQLNLAMLRMFRLARLFRAFRIFSRIRELYLLLSGFASSCRAIFFGVMMLLVMLLLFSILMVEFVHPINSRIDYGTCTNCSEAFNSVLWSTLTLFREIIAGGSWIISYRVVEERPLVGILLVMVVVVVSLGTMNLILAVIVERAAEAREKDVLDRIQQKDDEANEMKLRLLRLCSTMDIDNSYTLTLDELQAAYEELADFRNILKLMHIGPRDLKMVFQLMDQDDSGSVDYKEFCEELYLLSLTDQRWAVASTKHKIDILKKSVEGKLETVLSQMNIQNESQEKQLDGMELLLKMCMRTPENLSQPCSSPPANFASVTDAKLDEALSRLNTRIDSQEKQLSTISRIMLAEGAMMNSTSPYSVRNQSQCDDLNENIDRFCTQYDLESLSVQLQQLNSIQTKTATEVYQQAVALQRQAEFLAQTCDSVPRTDNGSQQRSQQKGNSLSESDQMQGFKVLLAQGKHLCQVFTAMQSEAIHLGSSVDKAGELMVLLGTTWSACGLNAIAFDHGALNQTLSI